MYDVPNPILGAAARRVRCARCAHEWMFAPEASESQPLDALPPGPAVAAADSLELPDPPREHKLERAFARPSITDPAPLPPPPKLNANEVRPLREERVAKPPNTRRASPVLVGFAWVLTVVLLGCFATAVVLMRDDVVKAWPATERAYRVLGLV
jgi:predicted Zn finger-like uncharacterized protein